MFDRQSSKMGIWHLVGAIACLCDESSQNVPMPDGRFRSPDACDIQLALYLPPSPLNRLWRFKEPRIRGDTNKG